MCVTITTDIAKQSGCMKVKTVHYGKICKIIIEQLVTLLNCEKQLILIIQQSHLRERKSMTYEKSLIYREKQVINVGIRQSNLLLQPWGSKMNVKINKLINY